LDVHLGQLPQTQILLEERHLRQQSAGTEVEQQPADPGVHLALKFVVLDSLLSAPDRCSCGFPPLRFAVLLHPQRVNGTGEVDHVAETTVRPADPVHAGVGLVLDDAGGQVPAPP
jgi:hypothetical protein